ncbi:hypothetical protein D5086_023468 [Populus alba]|uniref:Uncharacterized protein n=1 Tax=Populus alba TaxID=43335 RepID=A0ACC4B9V8_POPAL
MVKPSTMLYLSTHFSFHSFVAAPVCEVHPDLLNMQDIPQRKSVGKSKPRLADRDADGEYMTALPDQPSTSKMVNFYD